MNCQRTIFLPGHAIDCVFATIILLALFLAGSGCGSGLETPRADSRAQPAETGRSGCPDPRIRIPAVAGLFYPADGAVLSKTVDELLDSAPAHSIPRLERPDLPPCGLSVFRANCGHRLQNPGRARSPNRRHPRSQSLCRLSRCVAARRGRLPNTPGNCPHLGKGQSLVKTSPFVLEPRCRVQRPDWWQQAPKPAPADGEDTPETWEHSVEVQVPFLQKTLKNFKILPALLGNADPEQVAAALAPLLDDQTIVVASSDLSHYHPYEAAKDWTTAASGRFATWTLTR